MDQHSRASTIINDDNRRSEEKGDSPDRQLHASSAGARCTTSARIRWEDIILISGNSRHLTIPKKTLKTN
jgi:hypothetical protein